VTKIDGEASANNRKSKLFFFYEWEIKADWKGHVKSGEKSFKGTIEIPNLSEEHSPEDVDINVALNEDQSDGFKVKEFLRTKGMKVIRDKLAVYIKDLKEEFSQGMILPKKDGSTSTSSVSTASAENGLKGKEKELMNQSVVSAGNKEYMSELGVKINCKKLDDEEQFKCSISDLYRALTDVQMMRAYTSEDAMSDSTKGGRFSLFGGNVVGQFNELVPDSKIVMSWRFKTWPAEHYSTVTLSLQQREDCTILKLTQTGIPVTEYERTREGWKNYYWRYMKQRLGFGACLF